MSEHSFSLTPFPDSNIPAIEITGKISRRNNILAIQYALMGDTEIIRFPDISPRPTRKDDLWRATCFEFFLAIPNGPQYWEFNMSPSGDWNVYHMDAYRRIGLRQEMSIQQLQFSLTRKSECASVDATIDLRPIIHIENPIQVGISSVIQTQDGHETYWALTHRKLQADFHLRESFILELAE